MEKKSSLLLILVKVYQVRLRISWGYLYKLLDVMTGVCLQDKIWYSVCKFFTQKKEKLWSQDREIIKFDTDTSVCVPKAVKLTKSIRLSLF